MVDPGDFDPAIRKWLVSIVVPVYNEADNIIPLLDALRSQVSSSHETLLVYDFDEDSTLPPARQYSLRYSSLRLVKNTLGRGVVNALRTGLSESVGDVIVVTMADLSDDVSQIDQMSKLVHDGAGLVAASRYMKGGRQLGGPPLKSFLSRSAGLSLRVLSGIGTHDATNNFKAYSRDLLDSVDIASRSGFEVGLELATKAHLSGFRIQEIPTTWRDRTSGESRFKLLHWAPSYLRWYTMCILGTWLRAGRFRRRGAT